MPTLSYIWSLEKSTPFGRSLPVWAIIGSTPPPPGTVEVSYQSHRTHKIIYKVSIRSLKIRKYDKLNKQPRSISGTCLPRFNWDQAFLLLFCKKRDIMDDILRKQPAFCDAIGGFPAKWLLRNERRNSILMTGHCSDLGSASDWMKQIFNQSEALPRFG